MALSRDEAKHNLRSCLQELASVWASPEGKSLSEPMTRKHFIDTYIDCLGYRGIADLELEHPVKNTGRFIDYVLKIERQAVLAVEAKPLGVALSDDVGAQLLEYQVVENIEWGIATNARELWVYDYLLQGPTRDKCVMKLDFLAGDLEASFDGLFDGFWLLSKESMSIGTGLESLKQKSQLERAIEGAVLDKTSKVVQALRIDVKDRTQGKVKVTPDEVVNWLRTRLARGLALAAPPAAQAMPAGAPPEGRRISSFLKQMIERGIIPANAQVSAQFAGQEYTAVIEREGWLLLKGERFRKPGFAAKRITGVSTDGFEFWTYNGVPLARLRDKLWQA